MTKITSYEEKRIIDTRNVTNVKVHDIFLLPRYKAIVTSVVPHNHNEDLMVVNFRIMEGPNKNKLYSTLVPKNMSIDCINSTFNRIYNTIYRNKNILSKACFALIIVFLSAYVTVNYNEQIIEFIRGYYA